MQLNGQSESLQFNLNSFKLVRFDILDPRLRRQSIRKIARSLTLHQLQDCEEVKPSIDLFSDSPELVLRDVHEISEYLSQSNLKSSGDLIRKACRSHADLQLICCQGIYAARKAFKDLLLDPLQTIEPDVVALARKHTHTLLAYSKYKIEALRQDRPGHFTSVDTKQNTKVESLAASNPLTMLSSTKKSEVNAPFSLSQVTLRSHPTSLEVFKQIGEELASFNKNIWICTRDESVGGKILKELFARGANDMTVKFVKSLDRLTPLLLLSEIAASENPKDHLILCWDYLDYYEVIRL